MQTVYLVWSAWKNGAFEDPNVSYGLKVPVVDRKLHFSRKHPEVVLEIPFSSGADSVKLDISKESFWNDTCRELISVRIGEWLKEQGVVPWASGRPPKVRVEVVDEGRVRVIGLAS